VDLHGDGNIYSHQEYQVGIRCESCHGDSTQPPAFQTERGQKLRNIERADGRAYLQTKILSEAHPIPALFSGAPESQPNTDIRHGGHRRLECYACHSAILPQCYGCHMVRDDSRPAPIDWAPGLGEGQPARDSFGMWTGRKLFQLWNEAVLGVNRKERVAPFIPGGQAIVTHSNAEGENVKINHTFTTSGGLYGFSMNPVQPHNISVEARTCPSCHSSRKALGLGTDFVDLKRLGLQIGFSPDGMVDEEGARLQDSAHEGARPFTRGELQELFRDEVCSDCHTEAQKTPPGLAAPHTSLKGADQEHHRAVHKRIEPGEE
jgi:mono/diheme cytochrome c family protein